MKPAATRWTAPCGPRSSPCPPGRRCRSAARTDHLLALADGISRRFDDFLRAEIGDTGKPVGWAGEIDIPRGAANFRAFAELARTLDMESYMTDTPDGRQALNYAYRKPLGVVGVISPWNLPLLLLTWKWRPRWLRQHRDREGRPRSRPPRPRCWPRSRTRPVCRPAC